MELLSNVFTPRWEYWRCIECMGYWVTVEVHKGKIPDGISCKLVPERFVHSVTGEEIHHGTVGEYRKIAGCKGRMSPSKHRDPKLWPAEIPRVANAEFYHPSGSERRKMAREAPKLLKYVKDGGLILRPPSEATPIFPVSV